MKLIKEVVIVYLLIMDLCGFISMGIDKKKAKENKWRTPEARLLIIAAIGGALGSFIGMRVFHHKTRHIKFAICVPLFLIIHIIILALLVWKFIL